MLNVLDPVPQHMVATFDVIHLRLLVLGLPKDTWELACRNLLQLLKPGGWLQWEEADFGYVDLGCRCRLWLCINRSAQVHGDSSK